MLDEYGMPYIEGGWPGSNPKDIEFFAAARSMTWKTAKLAAFGSTRHRANRAEEDPNLYELVAAETPVVTIFGKSWDLHVIEVLGATLGAEPRHDRGVGGLRGRARPRGHLRRGALLRRLQGRPRATPCDTLRAARQAGARDLVLCDTNGGTLTDELVRIFDGHARRARPRTRTRPRSPGASTPTTTPSWPWPTRSPPWPPGARHVQATINGYGERCGNANMVSILANLALKTDLAAAARGRRRHQRPHLAVADAWRRSPTSRPIDYQPFVGRSAFAHKGGVHGAAVAKVERSYQHVDPVLVGNDSRLVVSELGGRANTRIRAEQLGHRLEGSSTPRR